MAVATKFQKARGKEEWLVRAGEAAHEQVEPAEEMEHHAAGI